MLKMHKAFICSTNINWVSSTYQAFAKSWVSCHKGGLPAFTEWTHVCTFRVISWNNFLNESKVWMSNVYVFFPNKVILEFSRTLSIHCVHHVNIHINNRGCQYCLQVQLLRPKADKKKCEIQMNTTWMMAKWLPLKHPSPTHRGIWFQMIKHTKGLCRGQMCSVRCSTPFIPEFSTANFFPDSWIHNEWRQKRCEKQFTSVSAWFCKLHFLQSKMISSYSRIWELQEPLRLLTLHRHFPEKETEASRS